MNSPLELPGELEKRHFRVLLRAFIRRFLDNELVSAEGDASQTLVHFVTLLAAASACIAYLLFMKYFGIGEAPAALRAAAAWEDREFLISLGMAITGFLTVICWDALFPDRRDVMVFGSMPVRTRTIFAAKMTAILLVLAIAGVAVHSFTAFSLPALFLGKQIALGLYLRDFFIHTISLIAASAFVFFGMLGLQGILMTICSRQVFQTLSAYVQLGALFTILMLFFMTPDIAQPQFVHDPANRTTLLLVPAFWFLGLYQWMLGSSSETVEWLAALATRGLAASVLIALGTYTLAYRRNLRKIVEDSGVVTSRKVRRHAGARLTRWICATPVERAVFNFISKTIQRNRQHRLLLAIYCGVGLAYVSSGLSSLLKGGGAGQWAAPNSELVVLPLILSFFLLLGLRFLFSVPVELRANWLFQMTEPRDPASYYTAVRKILWCYGVAPLALVPLPVYGALWGWTVAGKHLVLTFLLQMIIVELLLARFVKIPFTCSYLPGKNNLKMTFGFYWILFSFAAFVISKIETALLDKINGYIITVLTLSALLTYMIRRRRQREREHTGFLYEEVPEFSAITLGLQR